jgi:glutamine cyclotransferase
MLNELEYADGLLYANIYLTSYIVAIDLDKGMVVKFYSLFIYLLQNVGHGRPQGVGHTHTGVLSLPEQQRQLLKWHSVHQQYVL